jgi:hypothetical protein
MPKNSRQAFEEPDALLEQIVNEMPTIDPFKGLPAVLKAKVRAAFAPYSRDELCEDEARAALIVVLGQIWREWKGTSPRTVTTDTSPLGANKFPFGKWVVDLFEVRDEIAPSRYEIQKAIRLRR